jgi:hypothetical protein
MTNRNQKAAKPVHPVDMSLETLAGCLMKAKAIENLAKDKRIEWEERLAAKIECPEVGQATETLEDGTKVVVKRGFNFKADCTEIQEYFDREMLDDAEPIKTSFRLDEVAYEWYRTHNPAVFEAISKFVTSTPKKVAVTVTPKK